MSDVNCPHGILPNWCLPCLNNTVDRLRAELAAVTKERNAARNVLADLLSERRGSEYTEAQDEATAMERIARRLLEADEQGALPSATTKEPAP